jgi:hypothetical protein
LKGKNHNKLQSLKIQLLLVELRLRAKKTKNVQGIDRVGRVARVESINRAEGADKAKSISGHWQRFLSRKCYV